MKTEEELIWESYLSYHIQGRGDEVDFPLITEGLIYSVSLIHAQMMLHRNLSFLDELDEVDFKNSGIIIIRFKDGLSEKIYILF